MTDHATLRTLAEAATPGPWVADAPAGFGTIFAGVLGDSSRWLFDPVKGTNEDAAYIAACDPQTILALLDELETLRAALEAARFVARYWRDSWMEQIDRGVREAPLVTHPLAMVLAALDGETEPAQCGIDEGRWDDFRAALAGSGR